MELNALKKSIESKRHAVESYAFEHGINQNEINIEHDSDIQDSIAQESAETEAEILAFER